VIAGWQGDRPLVSIQCATYQHVGYIEDALRGFLGQDTTFPFEINIRDDASTDGTADIVRDYADRYPNIIRAVLETENRWPAVHPAGILRQMVRGDFVALCEGDDYWISASKIQRQVDELRRNRNAVASHHDCVVVSDGRVIAAHELPARLRRSLPSERLLRVGYIPIRTLCYRHPLGREIDSAIVKGDVRLCKNIALNGDLVYEHGAPMSVYRRHPGSLRLSRETHPRSERQLRRAISNVAVAKGLLQHGEASAARYWQRRALIALLSANTSWIAAFAVLPRAVAEAFVEKLRGLNPGRDGK
jgi:glycosyltransferase involved in cell wall biosynthesis